MGCLTAAAFGGVGGVRAQTLEDALVAAYLTNPDLEAQRAALRATDELVAQALGGWRPTLAIDGERRQQPGSTARRATVTFNTLSGSLNLDQELYSGGETVATTERAERLVRLERARLHAIEQDVLLDAVSVYTNLLAAQAVLDFAVQNETRLRRQLQATRDRFEVGEVTRTDVAQADARLSGAIADRVQAEGDVDAARGRISPRDQSGADAAWSCRNRCSTLPANEAEAQQLAEVDNPNVAAAQFDLAAARSDVDVARSALLPRLSVRGELTYTEDPNFTLDWRQRTR